MLFLLTLIVLYFIFFLPEMQELVL